MSTADIENRIDISPLSGNPKAKLDKIFKQETKSLRQRYPGAEISELGSPLSKPGQSSSAMR